MRGVSRTSFEDARDKLAEVLAAARQPGTGQAARRSTSGRAASGRAASTRAASGAAGPDQIGDELFAVLHLLGQEHGLRRALADPSRPADEKGAVVVELLHGKVSPATEEVVVAVVRSAWASTVDMTDAVEQLAVEAFAAAAEAAGQLDDLEDELFRFGRVVAAEPDLRAALTEPIAPPEGRRELLGTLLDGKVTPVTMRLITEMSLHPRGRHLAASLEMCTRIAAQRRQRLIAVVHVASGLSAQQRRRLAEALAANYGHDVYVNVVIDPTVVGGMTIQIGDELIDASVASRLAAVRRRLAG